MCRLATGTQVEGIILTNFSRVGLACICLFTAGCVSPTPDQMGNQPTTFDGLVPVTETEMDEAWVRPDFDPAAYTKIMFRGAGIEYRPVKSATRIRVGNQTQFATSEANKRRLESVVTEEFRRQLTQVQGYEITNEAGPDTLLLVVGLKDVVSHVPPEFVGRHEVYLSEVGTATLVLEFRDSESNAVMVRGVDRRAAQRYGQDFQKSSPVTNWPVVKRLAATWAKGLRKGIKDMQSGTN